MTITETTPGDLACALAAKLRRGDAVVAVLGLGYVGLSLAVALGRAGLSVRAVDVDLERVSLVNRGTSYIGDVASADLAALVAAGRLSASIDFTTAGVADAVVICVPTPLRKSREPDISCIVAAVEAILGVLRPGQLIVLESTTYPGTTEEILQSRLEAKGFVVGRDVFLAFSPERVDPGNECFTTATIPKVVGGVTPRCTELAAALYANVTSHVHRVSSPRVAETAKLLENTFRSVNIALVNEFALACRAIGVDSWEAIQAAATKPFGFMPFYPGPGTGGHCIPLDPLYLSWKLRLSGFENRFIALADEINRGMPRHVVTLIADTLNERGRTLRRSTVLIAGVTYKRDVNDVRESPALEVIRLLLDKGATVRYSDPFVPEVYVGETKLTSVPLDGPTLRAADCTVILTDHRAFDYPLIAREAAAIVDARNALRGVPGRRHKIVTL